MRSDAFVNSALRRWRANAKEYSLMFLQKLNAFKIWKRKVRVFGRVFQASTLDRLASLVLHKIGILGRQEVGLLRRLIKEGMTIVELGANQGLYTLLLSDLARPGKVFAFEPHPMLFEQLKANVCENQIGNVECYQIAVSNSAGTLTLKIGKLNFGDNYIAALDTETSASEPVQARRLDDLFEGKRVDFLKMDIQGGEEAALVGGRNMFEANHDIVLLFEFWPFGLRRAGVDPKRLLSFLTKLGFKVFSIGKSRLSPLNEASLPNPAKQLSYRNLVALRDPSKYREFLS